MTRLCSCTAVLVTPATGWAPWMALADSYTCYAPDLIGYGYSEGIKEGYYLSDFVEFAMGFTEALGLQSSVMVGHSLGGRVCLEIAFRYPERVRRLVLINTAGFSKLGRWGAFLGTLVWQGRMLLRHRQPYPKFLKENGKHMAIGYAWTNCPALGCLPLSYGAVMTSTTPWQGHAKPLRLYLKRA